MLGTGSAWIHASLSKILCMQPFVLHDKEAVWSHARTVLDLDGLRRGHPHAFQALSRCYSKALGDYVLRQGCDPDSSAVLVGHALERLGRQTHLFNTLPDVQHFLLRNLRQGCRQWLEQQAAGTPAVLELDRNLLEDPLLLRLPPMIAILPRACREASRLFFLCGVDALEIAQLQLSPEATVRNRIIRGRHLLKKHLPGVSPGLYFEG